MARILVIDDEKDIRSALRTLLEDVGHDVIEGEDGLDLPARVISWRVRPANSARIRWTRQPDVRRLTTGVPVEPPSGGDGH